MFEQHLKRVMISNCYQENASESSSLSDFKKDCKNEDCYIILGAENEGIAYDLLKENLDDCYRIPTTDKVRCLNVSNCAAIMLYLASTALNSKDIIFDHEPDTLKGENFIDDLDLSTLDRHHLEHKH